MVEKILFVDDDLNILSAYQRQFHKQFHIETALGGDLGLAAIANHGPYGVIVADMRMPGMNGIQFLSKARVIAPDSIRVMLTGNADQQTAIDAVNEGNIFRFLTKPCPPNIMLKTLNAGMEQYRLVMAEKELLEKTLSGSVKVLTDVLTLVNPMAFGRASRAQRLVRKISADLKVDKPWQMEIAAMLSHLGCIMIPEEILAKVCNGINLSESESRIFKTHPQIGSGLISNIPRLETVAEIVAYQEKHFDGSGVPCDGKRGEEIPLGARILKLAIDFDSLVTAGNTNAAAMGTIRQKKAWYDPALIESLERVLAAEIRTDIKSVKADELALNMILAEDVKTLSGMLIVAKGHEVTPLLRIRLKNWLKIEKISSHIKVMIPVSAEK
ncbi:MAG: response regulator [Candidatus Brocadia sp.]|jgi:response regulator RpfG family c-di-GMP phosphodiesterase